MKGKLSISPHLFIAFRYLLGRAREGGRYLWGAATGIAVSLVPIIVTLIVADGMIRGITDRYLELGTGHVRIYDFLNMGFDEIKPIIEVKDEVKGSWVERDGMAVIAGKKGKAGATIRAVEESFWQYPGALKFLTVVDGQAEITADNEAILGEALAQATGAEVGDTVRLMTVRVTEDGRNIPRITPFKVKGIVSAGYRELDALWCIVSYRAGQRILSDGLSSSFLIVKITNPYKDSDAFVNGLFPPLGPGYGAYTWKELQQTQYSSYESTRQILIFIMALIVMVAAVNVSSATAMLALERQRDISVLKAGGVSPASICRIFVGGAFLTGIIGAVIGISVGLLVGVSINQIIGAIETILNFFSGIFNENKVKILNPSYYLETVPIVIDWLAVFLIGLFTVLCSMLASWLPSLRAGRLKPLEILRKY
ncbi:MAG: ABC transporter permease [Treponema sp.]|jgi:lipoprotein-releasing system permease protein|nr:ABC transporter permease [Treponema sp.]